METWCWQYKEPKPAFSKNQRERVRKSIRTRLNCWRVFSWQSAMSFTLFSLLVICLASTAYAKVDPMHGVLGFSSGAYFAAQYQIAYSSVIRGAAIFAGGPYYCMSFKRLKKQLCQKFCSLFFENYSVRNLIKFHFLLTLLFLWF